MTYMFIMKKMGLLLKKDFMTDFEPVKKSL